MLVPFVGKLLDVLADGGTKGFVQVSHTPRLTEYLADFPISVPVADIGEQRLSETVYAKTVIHGRDGRWKVTLKRGVTKPHVGIRVDPSEGQVLGHAFHEPQGRDEGHGIQNGNTRAGAVQYVTLEGVNEFVGEDVFQLSVRSRER